MLFTKADDQANLYLKKDGKMVQTFKVSGAGSFETFITNIDSTIVSKILHHKNKVRTIGSATVATTHGLNYGHLVSTLDILRKNKITNIGVMSEKTKCVLG